MPHTFFVFILFGSYPFNDIIAVLVGVFLREHPE